MNKLSITLLFCIVSLSSFAEGDTIRVVSQVLITDSANKKIAIPGLGETNLLIFYPDPEAEKQNKHFTDYLEEHPIESDNISSFGIVNLRDAPLYPNSLVRFIARQKTKKTGARIFFDPNHAVRDGWGLGDVDDQFTIMFITKDCEIVFLKKGFMSAEDIAEFHRVIDRYR